MAQLGHEGVPKRRAAFFQKLRANRQLFGWRACVPAAPGAHLGEQGHELNRGLGQAVDPFCLCVGSSRRARQAERARRFSRSARMLEAMPSSECVRRSR